MNARGRESRLWPSVLLLSILLSGPPLFAKLGFQIGFNFIHNDGAAYQVRLSEFLCKSGYSFGVDYGKDFGSHLAIKAAVLYSLKVAKKSISYSTWSSILMERWTVTDIGMMNNHYLEFPLVVEWYPSTSSNRFHLIFGVYAAHLLKARFEWEDGIVPDPSRFSGDYAAIKHYDFGWVAGLGIKAWERRGWRAEIETKAEIGAINIAREGFSGQSGKQDFKNFSISLSLGITRGAH